MELFLKICLLKIKKYIFESLLKLFVKKMSLIISLIVLFILKIRFFSGNKEINNE